jgi:hypothetical protein
MLSEAAHVEDQILLSSKLQGRLSKLSRILVLDDAEDIEACALAAQGRPQISR